MRSRSARNQPTFTTCPATVTLRGTTGHWAGFTVIRAIRPHSGSSTPASAGSSAWRPRERGHQQCGHGADRGESTARTRGGRSAFRTRRAGDGHSHDAGPAPDRSQPARRIRSPKTTQVRMPGPQGFSETPTALPEPPERAARPRTARRRRPRSTVAHVLSDVSLLRVRCYPAPTPTGTWVSALAPSPPGTSPRGVPRTTRSEWMRRGPRRVMCATRVIGAVVRSHPAAQ